MKQAKTLPGFTINLFVPENIIRKAAGFKGQIERGDDWAVAKNWGKLELAYDFEEGFKLGFDNGLDIFNPKKELEPREVAEAALEQALKIVAKIKELGAYDSSNLKRKAKQGRYTFDYHLIAMRVDGNDKRYDMKAFQQRLEAAGFEFETDSVANLVK